MREIIIITASRSMAATFITSAADLRSQKLHRWQTNDKY